MSRADRVFIVGDINIRFDRPSNEHAMRISSILTDFGCGQSVKMPTHDDDGWLDVVISLEEDGPLDTEVIDVGLSDHRLVWTRKDFTPPQPVYETITSRA